MNLVGLLMVYGLSYLSTTLLYFTHDIMSASNIDALPYYDNQAENPGKLLQSPLQSMSSSADTAPSSQVCCSSSNRCRSA